jgi:hypothetical protein
MGSKQPQEDGAARLRANAPPRNKKARCAKYAADIAAALLATTSNGIKGAQGNAIRRETSLQDGKNRRAQLNAHRR